MNGKSSNIKITIHYLFIKQLYFLSLPFYFSFISHLFILFHCFGIVHDDTTYEFYSNFYVMFADGFVSCS
jgi:hypothetical protein